MHISTRPVVLRGAALFLFILFLSAAHLLAQEEGNKPDTFPVVKRVDLFKEGMLKSSSGDLIDMMALQRFPEAFVGGKYTAVVRLSGWESSRDDSDKNISLEVLVNSYTIGGIEPYSLALLYPKSKKEKIDEWKGNQVRLTFSLKADTYQDRNGEEIPFFAAKVTGIKKVDDYQNPKDIKDAPTEWIGKEVTMWVKIEKVMGMGPNADPPVILLDTNFSGRRSDENSVLVGVLPGLLDGLSKQRGKFPARFRIGYGAWKAEHSKTSDYILAEIIDFSPVYPYSEPDTALLYQRFIGDNRTSFHSDRLDKCESSVKKSIERRNYVPAYALDVREPETVSKVSGQSHTGEMITSTHGREKKGFVIFTAKGLHQFATLDEIRQLSPLPEEVYERGLYLEGQSSGTGEVTSGTTTIPTTVTSATFTPVFRRLVLSTADDGSAIWEHPRLTATQKRAQETCIAIKDLPEAIQTMRYALQNLEGEVGTKERRIEWLDNMIKRENTSAEGKKELKNEKKGLEKELSPMKKELKKLLKEDKELKKTFSELREELGGYWLGSKQLKEPKVAAPDTPSTDENEEDETTEDNSESPDNE